MGYVFISSIQNYITGTPISVYPSTYYKRHNNGLSIGLQTGRPGLFDARCHQIPSEYTRSTCSLNQSVRKPRGPNHKSRGLEIISLPFSSMPKLWRWRYRWYCHLSSLREFHRAKSYCHLYGAQGLVQRQVYF
ncbi:hypothetical protein TNCV_1879701 [Trichonephila clavipes]|nr:hypothetical protein TNCV_1879701 [Trichonephila clavipes]